MWDGISGKTVSSKKRKRKKFRIQNKIGACNDSFVVIMLNFDSILDTQYNEIDGGTII
jgi:hypothetical protein